MTMQLLKTVEQKIRNVLESFNLKPELVTIVPSGKPELGEFQYNGIMSLAKLIGKNPVELANVVISELEKDSHFESVSVAGPGFINIRISNNVLLESCEELLKTKEYITKLPKKKIVVDYGGPNVAKVLHVGHLRSGNIGEALKRLGSSLGYEMIGDIHLGDYGLQMGMIMLEIETRYPNLDCFQKGFQEETVADFPITNDDLIDLYPIASTKAKESESVMERAREITYLFQNNHLGYKALWRSIMNVSLKDMKELYDKLNVHFELWNGESDAEKYIPEMIEYLRSQNMITTSEGAEVIEVTESTDKLAVPPLLLIKSNKTVSYETTDLATLWEREKMQKPDEVWYVVDKRQDLHFKQVFRAAYKSKIVSENTILDFMGFGTMNGKDGRPFKTRNGGVMTLRNLLELVKEETNKNMIPSITGEERNSIAEVISVGTIKFADLLSHRSTDYIFDPEKFSDANGKTGPFILYSTIRMRSLLQKAQEMNLKDYHFTKLKGSSDKKVLLHMTLLQKTLESALKEKSLHEITDFLYNLNNMYNNFYSENRILTETDIDLQNSWLALTKMTYEINQILLDILAIEVPIRM